MADLNGKFEEKAAPPALIEPQAYYELCEALVKQGDSQFKTKPIGAYLMLNVKIDTLKSNRELETHNEITVGQPSVKKGNLIVDNVYVLADASIYEEQQQRDMIIADVAEHWGDRIIHQDKLGVDYVAPGVWLNIEKKVTGDYVVADPAIPTFMIPDPNATRIVLPLAQSVKIPCTWGTFDIDAGGTLAVREKDVPALVEALQSVRNGSKTIEEALYTTNEKGETFSRFDIYGMEPGFLEKNYGHVELKDSTKEILAAFSGSKPAQPSAPTQRNG